MNELTYLRPASLAEAVTALRTQPDPKVLAGGQSLIPLLKLGLAQPATLVSLRSVAELRGIRADSKELVIGAAATHAEVEASSVVRESIGALAQLAEQIGDAQVRNRGTLGGSIAHNDPAADYPAALLALNALVTTDRRSLPAEEFFTGMFSTALEPDEIITGVRFPVPERAAYAKFPNPASRFAIVGVFVAKRGAGVRVAVTGAGPAAFRAASLEAALSAKFAPEALDGVGVSAGGLVSDLHASAEYRAHLIGVMARRAVAACA